MNPLVSIIIPAYNAEEWLRETLESAIGQDYPNKEILVVNDGSTDHTLDIATGFASAQVKVVNQANAGGPAARNKGLACARGEYIQWIDHDDILAPDKISQQFNALGAPRNERILLSSPFATFFYRRRSARFAPGPLWRNLTPLEYFQLKFSGNAWLQTSAWLVSRTLTEAAGPWWDLKSPDDDGEYFCRVVAAAEKIQFVPASKSYWRVGNYGSFSKARSPAETEARFRAICRSIEHFRALEDSDRTRACCVKFLQHRLPYFYPEHKDIVERMFAFARELGGVLTPPPVKWKYRWLKPLFGSRAASRAEALLPRWREGALRTWDKLLYDLSSKSAQAP